MKELGIIDIEPWGNVRQLPDGAMQLFVRDPSVSQKIKPDYN